MSLLSLMGISTAHAATTTASAAAPHQGSLLSMLPMLILFIAAFYFLLVRPQSKRAKEQRLLLSSLSVGDEVLTSGGIAGRLTKLRDSYAVITVGKDVEMIFQKASIATVLPKGTLETIQ
ncbi:MAG: preprotein translocase subunit YajC [Gammaproteobacteria bacterium CG_4_10_14_0_8_um_filter_38_16]|nr:MAG: preprotein translocase subunit YajC [Gammaproteobacteria bacterium CG_4_10_14_0_8_um_filter_38_16]PJA03115.1 MAG: preprotein translocase subunit YajC [Gammaproteobacteria bacterium CG_4_10_14_0_2_um_filter_38_22]PJB10372.1 MAG: preprotein translocase subunit YajC [Gammaproteobacteria bacterium CG_4_9_14_3_um_filter_38_9]